jgi:hypothetical protein
MADPNIVSGDRVVDLAASLRFAALVAGAISCAVALWIIKQNVLWSIAALVVGGIAGFCIGLVLSPLIFPAAPGQVAVVKLGPGVVTETLKANLIGAVVSGLVVAAVPAGLFAESTKLMLLTGIGGGIGAVIGAALGYLASRP